MTNLVLSLKMYKLVPDLNRYTGPRSKEILKIRSDASIFKVNVGEHMSVQSEDKVYTKISANP